ncbi:unnamed protein product [Ixodes persulcatus]
MKRKKSPHLSNRALTPSSAEASATSALSLPSLQAHGSTTPSLRVHNSSGGSLDGEDTFGDPDSGSAEAPMAAVTPGGTASASGVLGGSSSLLANGNNDGASVAPSDETDHLLAHTPDLQKTRAAIEHVSQKIARTRELIKAEQTTRDDNVNEYLKLAANADRQQMQRIKNVFEKKNQKSAQTIAQLQKKLENYIKRKRDLETHGASSSWQPRDVLQNVGQGISGVVGNIKGGLSGLASVAHSSTDNKYPSDDDSSSLTSESSQMASHQGSTTGAGGVGPTASPRHPPLGGGGGAGLAGSGAATGGSSAEPLLLGAASSSSGLGPSLVVAGAVAGGGALASEADIEPLLMELNERKDECQRLAEEIEALKNQMHHECSYFSQALQEERYRYERLEEQMNDLIELHQNEIENLKQGIADMEEKVQYQSEERLRDVQELLESCQTRISRMEHQQHQHLQQLVSLDALDNSQARALGLKLVNVLLMLLQLVLLLISTVANIVMPFLQSRVRIVTTGLLILVICSAVKQWQELSAWIKIQFTEILERWK